MFDIKHIIIDIPTEKAVLHVIVDNNNTNVLIKNTGIKLIITSYKYLILKL